MRDRALDVRRLSLFCKVTEREQLDARRDVMLMRTRPRGEIRARAFDPDLQRDLITRCAATRDRHAIDATA